MIKTRMSALLYLCVAAIPCAAQSAPLTTIREIHNLTDAQAARALPVDIEGTVTFYRWFDQTLFIEDDGVGIYVLSPPGGRFSPEDRVRVRGTTHNSFRPEIFAQSVTVLGRGTLPEPVPATFDEMSHGQLDSMLVRTRGRVRTADLAISSSTTERTIVLGLLMDGGRVLVNLNSSDPQVLGQLLDAEVELTGVAAGTFDGKNQLTGIELNVSSLADIRVVKPAGASPWSMPFTPMDQILAGYHEVNHSQRIRVHGAITYYQPGSMAVLQDGAQSLRVMTRSYAPLRIGDEAEATGFPELMDGFLTLGAAEIGDTYSSASVRPLPASWDQLSSSSNLFDLVSIEGEVEMEARAAAQDEYLLVVDGHLFSAIYRHPDLFSQLLLPPMKVIPLGSRVRVTGICFPLSSDPFSGPVPFDILVRDESDLAVVARPRWLSVRHLVMLVGVLLLAVFAVGLWALLVERRSRRQIVSVAYLEKRRARILEDINNGRPLAEILELITELVSARLQGAACWCQLVDGARLGNCPAGLPNPSQRIRELGIRGRSGGRLGTLYAAFHARTRPRPAEQEALAMAAALATLAIETSRLYSDLVHRSEFDLLTDVPNRFSLEKLMDAKIEAARQTAGAFGLLYIDLDGFKQVNDLYGHGVGDLYLQEAAERMKRQLRPGDILARVGGDEFVVLVAGTQSRAGVKVIAARLEQCFGEPFRIGEHMLRGSASIGIALYPEDGLTRDTLLSAADVAMYGVKRKRQESGDAAPRS